MKNLVDTHIHLYDESYNENRDEIINEIEKKLDFVVNISCDYESSKKCIEYAEKYKFMYATIGYHPCDISKYDEEKMEELLKLSKVNKKIVALGEIGLDYHYSSDTAGLQQKALIRQFEIAAKLDLPVNIHLRDATDDFFKVMDICRHLGLRGNLHAFSGSYEIFQRLQKYGEWYVGIGGVITFKNSHISESVKKIPLERIILETDSPYLTPVPYRGKRNESSYIPIIAEKIALLKNISIEEVAAATTHNATTLFRI